MQFGRGGSPLGRLGAIGEQTPSFSTGKGRRADPTVGNCVPVVSTLAQAVRVIAPWLDAGAPEPTGRTSPTPKVQERAPANERTEILPPLRAGEVLLKPPTARSVAPSRFTSPLALRSMEPPWLPELDRPAS